MIVSQSLNKWIIQVQKMKATFHCLNMFNFDVTSEAMIAECWMPQYDVPQVNQDIWLEIGLMIFLKIR